jgi:hypothetical protein
LAAPIYRLPRTSESMSAVTLIIGIRTGTMATTIITVVGIDIAIIATGGGTTIERVS